jgi:hypothetical protein
MAQDELQLKIVLDDGQVVKGFLNIEKAATKTAKNTTEAFTDGQKEISEGFSKLIPAQAREAGSKIFEALNSPIGRITGAIALAGFAVKKAFDFTLEGEKLLKIEKQFDALANTFGVAGETLKTNFVGSLGGLVDDSDAVQALNKAFVTLGDKVTQLPQVMEIARKATNLFGGDVTQNFETINQAIATGATRQLRGLGIIIDSDKAYEKYAKSIGTTKDALTEAGRQQAILNEVIEKGATRFKNVSAESGGATDAFQRLKVSTQNLFEDITKVIAEKLSPLFTTLLNGANSFVQSLSSAFGFAKEDINSLTQKQKDLTKELEASTKMAEMFQKAGVSSKGPLEQELKRSQALRLELAGISEKIENIQRSSITPSAVKDIGSKDLEKQLEIEKKRQTELDAFKLQQTQQRVQAEISLNNLKITEFSTAEEKIKVINDNFNLQKKLSLEQNEQQLEAVRQKYREQKLSGTTYEEQSIKAIQDNYAQQRLLASEQLAQQTKLINRDIAIEQASGFQQTNLIFGTIYEGFKAKSADVSKTLLNLGKQIRTQIGGAFTNSIIAATNAFAKGEDGLDAFVKSALGGIGDIAIQYGALFLIQGAGFEVIPGLQASGSVLLSQGAALLALGAVLKSLSGGATKSTSSSGASSDTGGGIASTPSPTTDITAPQDLRNQAPATQVAVNINGSVYDSDETGSRIVDLINQAFDKKGVVIQQGVLA